MRSFSPLILGIFAGALLALPPHAASAATAQQHDNVGITPVRQIKPPPPPLPTEGKVWSVIPGGGDGGGHHGGDIGSGHTNGGSVGGGSSGNQGGIGGIGGLGDSGTGQTGGHSTGASGLSKKK